MLFLLFRFVVFFVFPRSKERKKHIFFVLCHCVKHSLSLSLSFGFFCSHSQPILLVCRPPNPALSNCSAGSCERVLIVILKVQNFLCHIIHSSHMSLVLL